MIDHVYVSVTNIDRSLAFYSEALKPLGWVTTTPLPAPRAFPILTVSVTTYSVAARRSDQASGYVYASSARLDYLGLVCDSNELVDAAYAAAIKAGGTDEGEPADRPYFAPGYYAANDADFDGNRIGSYTKRGTPRGTHSSRNGRVNADYLHERLPKCELNIIDAGHFIWEDTADTYAALATPWYAGGCAKAEPGSRRLPALQAAAMRR